MASYMKFAVSVRANVPQKGTFLYNVWTWMMLVLFTMEDMPMWMKIGLGVFGWTVGSMILWGLYGQSEPSRRRRERDKLRFLVMLWCVGWISAAVAENGDKQEEARIRQAAEGAYFAAEKAVKQSLTSPSTAKFSSLYWNKDTGVLGHGYQQWQAFGYVDAQNTFGALLRQNWRAVVQLNGGAYQTVWIKIGDSESGPMPAMRRAPLAPVETPVASGNTNKAVTQAAATLKHHQELADKGDPYGLYRMGKRYLEGDGVEKDPGRALGYLNKAAAAGQEDARKLVKEWSKKPNE
jgi:TPR repeat protein